MSTFTTPLICVVLDNMTYQVYQEFDYYIGYQGSSNNISVPAGFITDFASIPRILWSVLPPNGKYTKAAVLHDYLYKNAIKNKQWADDVFYEAMLVLGVSKITAKLMYNAVKYFGRGNYVIT